MRTMNGHAATAILRAITDLARRASTDLDRITDSNRQKPIIIVEAIESTDWASATFVGEIHVLHLRVEGVAADTARIVAYLQGALPEYEIPILGRFVAEIAVVDPEASDAPGDDITGSQPITIRALVIRD